MTDLSKIKLGVSPLTGAVFLYRHGKDQSVALEKRGAEADMMIAFVEFMMHGTPTGSKKCVRLGDRYYEVRARPISKDEFEAGIARSKRE